MRTFFFFWLTVKKARYSLRLDWRLFLSFLLLLFIPQLVKFLVGAILREDLLLALGKYPTSFWPRRKSTCLGFSGSPAAESRSANSGHMPSVSKALVLEQRRSEVLLAGPRVSSFSSVCAGPCPYASTGRWCPLPKLQASPCPSHSDSSSQRKSPKAGPDRGPGFISVPLLSSCWLPWMFFGRSRQVLA